MVSKPRMRAKTKFKLCNLPIPLKILTLLSININFVQGHIHNSTHLVKECKVIVSK